ncbi:MAG: ethylbenzene dehydrogenase-related protein [Desulfuromonadales bacterium]|nr:ethylbenzene dehydrogenase-related protein [Desulfuromonadales bacterium]
MRFLVLFILCVVTAFVAILYGCGEVASDRTYALWLDHDPTASDWQRALPREVTVRGGRPHKLQSFTDIDEDTVHTSTASCHHGSRLPDPIAVAIRSFYTDQNLFLQLSWADATPDQTMQDWRFDGETWHNTAAIEDGFGILWDARGAFNDFSCSYACHISDFGVSKASFHASNKMRMVKPDSWLDLWNWKAARTANLGFADDRYLDEKGMHGDTPGELFTKNSTYHLNNQLNLLPFGEGDSRSTTPSVAQPTKASTLQAPPRPVILSIVPWVVAPIFRPCRSIVTDAGW